MKPLLGKPSPLWIMSMSVNFTGNNMDLRKADSVEANVFPNSILAPF